MPISSALCHQQELAQRATAEQATLGNVRESATRAADAWQKEGVNALAREQRELARLNRAKFTGAIEKSEARDPSSVARGEDHE